MMPRVELPRLDLRVIPGGRGRGPGMVIVPRDQLAERESEAIATAALLLEGIDRAMGAELSAPISSLAVVADLRELQEHVSEYLAVCRARAALIDPPQRPAA